MSNKFFAFISYSSKDIKWGKKLQKKLEHYKLPNSICKTHNWQSRTPMRPVFFAPSDIQPGGLSDELKQRLKSAQHLIVICSPNSAKSNWVGMEISYFYSLGRAKNVHFFIIDGIPHSGNQDTECYHPILEKLEIPEILGSNINEKVFRWSYLNSERAQVQLITKLLGIEFDVLWNRHKRLLIQKIITRTLGTIMVIAAIIVTFFFSQPVELKVKLKEVTPTNTNLPPLKNARVTLVLDNEIKDTTILNINEGIAFPNIPHNFLGKDIQIQFSCADYLSIDTTLKMARNLILNVSRDVNKYGHERFILYNKNMVPLANSPMEINGRSVMTDANGRVDIVIPIEEQRMKYHVTSPIYKLDHDSLDSFCGDSECFCVE